MWTSDILTLGFGHLLLFMWHIAYFQAEATVFQDNQPADLICTALSGSSAPSPLSHLLGSLHTNKWVYFSVMKHVLWDISTILLYQPKCLSPLKYESSEGLSKHLTLGVEPIRYYLPVCSVAITAANKHLCTYQTGTVYHWLIILIKPVFQPCTTYLLYMKDGNQLLTAWNILKLYCVNVIKTEFNWRQLSAGLPANWEGLS